MTMASPTGEVLLLSGGLDSTAIAATRRPALTVFIDYGQRPARGEARAAGKIADLLGLEHLQVRMDLTALGGGLLLGEEPLRGSPSPEWWPYRNQFLLTAAAAIAIQRDLHAVVIGSVTGDGARHADGTSEFFTALDRTLGLQEGHIRVLAPALQLSTYELVISSGLTGNVLGWTTSCHRAELPCGACPGCWKRTDVMQRLAAGADPGADMPAFSG